MEDNKKTFYINQSLFLDMIKNNTTEYYSFYKPGEWVSIGDKELVVRLSSILNEKWETLPEKMPPYIFTRGHLSFSISKHSGHSIFSEFVTCNFVARSLTTGLDPFIFGTDLLIHPLLEVTISDLSFDNFKDEEFKDAFKDFIRHLYYLHPMEYSGTKSEYFLGLIKKHEQMKSKD